MIIPKLSLLPLLIWNTVVLLDLYTYLFQYFVDLAGSEKAAENSGDRFKEGCAINKSLFTLANVIRKLSGDDK